MEKFGSGEALPSINSFTSSPLSMPIFCLSLFSLRQDNRGETMTGEELSLNVSFDLEWDMNLVIKGWGVAYLSKRELHPHAKDCLRLYRRTLDRDYAISIAYSSRNMDT